MTKKALIFGITGQDGSYLAELLLSKGYSVTGVTRRVSVDTTQRISHLLPKINIIEGDITDQFSIMNSIHSTKPDEIYNLAAQSHVATSFLQPSLTFLSTANGCMNILESIRSLDLCDSVKFYQASSSEMFGRNYLVDKNGDKYQDENTPFMPQSPYAIAKVAAHNLVDNYRRSYGIFGCCGILFNHESERRGDKFVTRKITQWIAKWHTSKNKNIPQLRLGNLDAIRDWGHAEDYVKAMWLMLQQDEPGDYVVSTEKTHSVRDFLDSAFSYVDVDDWSDLVVIDPKFYRPSEVDYLNGRCTKAKNKLGWRADISFDELVHRMLEHDINEEKLRRSGLQKIQD